MPLKVMSKWLSKILLIFISLSFFTSAVELNVGAFHHTFFDEYDTYVKAEQVSLDHATVDAPDDNPHFLFASVFSFCYKSIIAQQVSLEHFRNYHLNHYQPKLFLLNSVWRI